MSYLRAPLRSIIALYCNAPVLVRSRLTLCKSISHTTVNGVALYPNEGFRSKSSDLNDEQGF